MKESEKKLHFNLKENNPPNPNKPPKIDSQYSLRFDEDPEDDMVRSDDSRSAKVSQFNSSIEEIKNPKLDHHRSSLISTTNFSREEASNIKS